MNQIRSAAWFLVVVAVAALCQLPCHGVRAQSVIYKLTVRNDWSQAHHKAGAPAFSTVEKPHFSHLGGGTHNADLVVWEVGQLSSPGMIKMQETGWIDEPNNRSDLKNEFDRHLASGIAGSFLNYPIPDPWFPAGTDTILTFNIEPSHPLVTLVSMLGPSPDWFVGVAGLNLRDGNRWQEHVEVDLYPYDGGSRSRDNQFALFGPTENPQLPIRQITDTDDTLLLGSLPIGKFTFELLSSQPALGDFNDDDLADGRDFLLWQRGETSSPMSPLDLDDWQFAFGASASTSATLAVPEPATCWLVAGLVATLWLSVGMPRERRRRP
jgi:hypothetical protein